MINSNKKCFYVAMLLAISVAQVLSLVAIGHAQTDGNPIQLTRNDQLPVADGDTLSRYIDPVNGLTVDQAVKYSIENNPELKASRAELEAARSRLRQAKLRPNPTLEITRSEQIGGGDNNTMASAMLPLELGGRRSARIAVARGSLELQQYILEDRERQLAAEVRMKFGEALAEIHKLAFTEDLLDATQRGYRLVQARVTEGRTPPLEQNMVLVEVNLVRSMRETSAGKAEVALLELRNLMGLNPEEALRLRGDFSGLDLLPPVGTATEQALGSRPDLLASRVAENVAAAQIELARSEGRLDASLMAGYERMDFGFPVRGFTAAGELVPVQSVFHSFKAGVVLNLPVRNRNQGAVEAAVAEADAARRRTEFVELTVRREVAAAYARYNRATRAKEIFRVGVRDQANANLSVIRQTYELGAKTLLDYIAEQRRFIEVENEFIDAVLDTYKARVEIERASNSPGLVTR